MSSCKEKGTYTCASSPVVKNVFGNSSDSCRLQLQLHEINHEDAFMGIKNISNQTIRIHPMITRQMLRMMPDDEVDNYMIQLVGTERKGKVTTINVHDFHRRIIYEEPMEKIEEKMFEACKHNKSPNGSHKNLLSISYSFYNQCFNALKCPSM